MEIKRNKNNKQMPYEVKIKPKRVLSVFDINLRRLREEVSTISDNVALIAFVSVLQFGILCMLLFSQ